MFAWFPRYSLRHIEDIKMDKTLLSPCNGSQFSEEDTYMNK